MIHKMNQKGRSKPITLRNVSPEIARAIRQRAGEEGISLNKAVGSLLRAQRRFHFGKSEGQNLYTMTWTIS